VQPPLLLRRRGRGDDTAPAGAAALLAGGASLDALAEAALNFLLGHVARGFLTFAEAVFLSRLAVALSAREVRLEVLLGRIRLLVVPLLEAVLLLW